LGAEVIDFVMRLEREAEASGGAVCSLLGNHDLLLLAVARHGDFESRSPRRSIWADWTANGGLVRDVRQLTDDHLCWLARRPALGRHGSTLLAHCDSTLYLDLGGSLEAVNESVASTLAGDDTGAWADLDDGFWRRNELCDPVEARRFLEHFGCERLVHGHTPISAVVGGEPGEVTEPLVYADGLCTNVDGGLYLGGSGFLLPLP
jgi:hypothetical protein